MSTTLSITLSIGISLLVLFIYNCFGIPIFINNCNNLHTLINIDGDISNYIIETEIFDNYFITHTYTDIDELYYEYETYKENIKYIQDNNTYNGYLIINYKTIPNCNFKCKIKMFSNETDKLYLIKYMHTYFPTSNSINLYCNYKECIYNSILHNNFIKCYTVTNTNDEL
jgi:hypothetical protein